jgi:hypothetical protein
MFGYSGIIDARNGLEVSACYAMKLSGFGCDSSQLAIKAHQGTCRWNLRSQRKARKNVW